VTAAHALRLHEELLLLGLHERTGKLAPRTGYATAGGVLAELLLGGRIEVSGKRAIVDAAGRGSAGDPVLGAALARIRAAGRRAALATWVGRLGRDRGLLHRVARGLVARGVLRAEETRILGVFRSRRYPERDPAPELDVLDRIEGALETVPADLDERTAELVALAYHAGLLRVVYGRAWQKANLRAIRERIELCEVGDAARRAIAAVNAAVAAAVAAGGASG
jgi:hypothetical protein